MPKRTAPTSTNGQPQPRCRLCTIILGGDPEDDAAAGLCVSCQTRPEAAGLLAQGVKAIIAHRATGELRTVTKREANALTQTAEWFYVLTEPAELAQRPVPAHQPPPPRPVKPKPKRQGTFAHPDGIPYADDMLNDLAQSTKAIDKVSVRDLAATIECDLYNAWVLIKAHDGGLLPPGELSRQQFTERFWGDDAPERFWQDED